MDPPENILNYMTIPIGRRAFLFTPAAPSLLMASDEFGKFEPWTRGLLDIHHISTGRGNSVLAICPDGTSIMVAAGAVKGPTDAMGPARPDSTRRPGEWIARYAMHHPRTAPRQELDYLVLTHFHGDHMGDVRADSPASRDGTYQLTGVSDVAELLPIHCLIDRGYPDYNYPALPTYDGTLNYIRFVRSLAKRGTRVESCRSARSARSRRYASATAHSPTTAGATSPAIRRMVPNPGWM
jgi:hypothetical protein